MSMYGYLIVLFLTAFFSGALYFIFRWDNSNRLKLILAFSGAYLFSVSVVTLLPEIYHISSDFQPGYWVLGGFFFQLLLDYFSEGIEHGHMHVHKGNRIPFGMMLSLCIHAFFESMPIGSDKIGQDVAAMLLAGIVIHNVPIAIALSSVLTRQGLSRTRCLTMLLIFSLMGPFGILVSRMAGSGSFIQQPLFYTQAMAFVVGIFLHISTTILFETSENHRFNRLKLTAIASGVLIALLTAH